VFLLKGVCSAASKRDPCFIQYRDFVPLVPCQAGLSGVRGFFRLAIHSAVGIEAEESSLYAAKSKGDEAYGVASEWPGVSTDDIMQGYWRNSREESASGRPIQIYPRKCKQPGHRHRSRFPASPGNGAGANARNEPL
jgi:hypothetical protein